MMDAGEKQLVYCSTELMLADALEKGLAQQKFTAFVNAMMLEETILDQSGRLEGHEATRSRSEREHRLGLIHACESMLDSNFPILISTEPYCELLSDESVFESKMGNFYLTLYKIANSIEQESVRSNSGEQISAVTLDSIISEFPNTSFRTE
jgi:hypothetical protein